MSPSIKFSLCVATLLLLMGPASAQTFEDRWGIVPKAHAAEPPPAESAKPPPQNEMTATPAPPPQEQAPSVVLTGKASFYAYRHGKTASGARYDRDALTAASRTLPLGTRLRVTDVKTRKSVDVTVTDRGPASKRLILDLSLGAARALGMGKQGVAEIRAQIIS